MHDSRIRRPELIHYTDYKSCDYQSVTFATHTYIDFFFFFSFRASMRQLDHGIISLLCKLDKILFFKNLTANIWHTLIIISL